MRMPPQNPMLRDVRTRNRGACLIHFPTCCKSRRKFFLSTSVGA